LKKGLKISPDNLELRQKLLKYYLGGDMLLNGMDLLVESLEILKDEALPLWESMELYILCCSRKMVYIYI